MQDLPPSTRKTIIHKTGNTAGHGITYCSQTAGMTCRAPQHLQPSCMTPRLKCSLRYTAASSEEMICLLRKSPPTSCSDQCNLQNLSISQGLLESAEEKAGAGSLQGVKSGMIRQETHPPCLSAKLQILSVVSAGSPAFGPASAAPPLLWILGRTAQRRLSDSLGKTTMRIWHSGATDMPKKGG